jgi:hypothetical protein
MQTKIAVLIMVLLLSFLTVDAALFSVSGWSNGGYSDDPSNPDYGTHDWIAEHALDWLPPAEKQFIVNNIANYLYGTELPDNGGTPDGIGDTTKHHVYYFTDGLLQDDASAVRAQEEYDTATSLFKSGDLANAAKRFGAMAHYVCDVAVFGHVMGSGTEWGSETHHSDYEEYVNERTNSYNDEFNTFLVFDGVLSRVPAYNATLTLAYDTTFDTDGNLTCIWMDENYNWTNSTFMNRCGESLNLAVNLIADVVHTFFLEMQGVAHFIIAPFHYQEKSYYCGPAALQMVFDFYGENISQLEIADVARTVGPPLYSTYTDELRRAAHFSNISTSMGSEMSESITGYNLRGLGYAAFEDYGMILDELKTLIDQNFPIILLMRWIPGEQYGHYRVAIGYNQTHIFLHDPWNNIAWGGEYGGPNLAMNYSFFLDMWDYSGHWGLFASPWKITINMSNAVYVGEDVKIAANIMYLCPSPFSIYEYTASSCLATITLPQGLNLAEGESATKNLGNLKANSIAETFWLIEVEQLGNYTISVEAEGIISGSVEEKPNVGPSYDYRDRIGGYSQISVMAKLDENPPYIEVPTQNPSAGIVMPYQNVSVFVNVTDMESGVKNVTLYYSLNSSQTWTAEAMNYNSTLQLYSVMIPGQPEETYVRFRIVAYDKVGNNATRDEMEHCAYRVIPEFPLSLMTLILVALTLIATYYTRKKWAKHEPKLIRP